MEKCVCMTEHGCMVITRSELIFGHNCDNCPFYKSEKQYIDETGMTYDQAMKKVDEYVRKVQGYGHKRDTNDLCDKA